MPDKLGRTAMFYAVLYNQEEILEYFIEKEANCNVMLVPTCIFTCQHNINIIVYIFNVKYYMLH